MAAAFAILSLLACMASPPAQEGPKIDGWDQAQERFLQWQNKMWEARARIQSEVKPRLSRNVVPPLGSCDDSGHAEDAHPYRIRMGSMFLPPLVPLPDFELRAGKPTVEVSVEAEAGVSKVVFFKHAVRGSWSLKDNSFAFKDVVEAKASLPISKGPVKTTLEPSASFALLGTQVNEERAGAQTGVSMDFGGWSAGLAMTPEGELQISGGPGFEPLPKATRKIVRLRGGITGTLSVPVKVTNVQYGSPFGLSQAIGGAAAAIARMLTGTCPYCGAAARIPCRQCADKRTIACDRCGGKLRERCSDCNGAGFLSCPPTRSCGNCRAGKLRCGPCGGSGSVIVTESESCMWCDGTGGKNQRTTETCPVCKGRGGVDFDGDGTLDSTCDTTIETQRWVVCSMCRGGERTKEVRKNCGSCGGSGDAGTCDRCGGDGSLTCDTCGGSGRRDCGDCVDGWVPCPRCRGSGKIVCPTCHGKPILCPLCSAKGKVGEASRAAPVRKLKIGPRARTNASIVRLAGKLERFLPEGTVLTSGDRTVEDQLRIIEGFARREKLLGEAEHLTLEAERWKEIYRELLKRKYQVNPPVELEVDGRKIGPSPHFKGNCVDLSGAPLDRIMEAVQSASRDAAGTRFSILQLKKESGQNAVHLQFKLE